MAVCRLGRRASTARKSLRLKQREAICGFFLFRHVWSDSDQNSSNSVRSSEYVRITSVTCPLRLQGAVGNLKEHISEISRNVRDKATVMQVRTLEQRFAQLANTCNPDSLRDSVAEMERLLGSFRFRVFWATDPSEYMLP